jgi:hypothetical protein
MESYYNMQSPHMLFAMQGHLDKNSPNPGFVLLTFYNLHEGKDRKEFENELLNRFGHLVKMPLLKPDRLPMPSAILEILEEGLQLYRRHTNKHKRYAHMNTYVMSRYGLVLLGFIDSGRCS